MNIQTPIVEARHKNTILIEDGKVKRLSIWTLHDGRYWNSLVIERRTSDFECSLCEPGGADTIVGTLEHVMQALPSDAGEVYRKLFLLVDPTGAELRDAGFGAVAH